MARYEVTSPEGKRYEVTAPDGASPEEVQAFAQKTFGASKEPTAAELAAASKPAFITPSSGKGRKQSDFLENLLPGAIRGAASIGNTLMLPADAMQGLVEGRSPMAVNREYRQQADDALRDMGANPNSPGYKTGKLVMEGAGTLGVGPALAGQAVRAGIPALAPIINAIRSGGMTAGPAAPIGARAVGGAITGGASAGLVDPEQAAAGGVVGAVLPAAARIAGKVGNAVGRTISGPAQAPEVAQAIQAARGAGYVIPPSQANPTLANRALEGFSGKITTAQNASARNQAVSNDLAATAIGLPAGTKIEPAVLKQVRDQAGQAYDALKQSGTVTPGTAYDQALQRIEAPFLQSSKGFPNAKPSQVIELVESLRSPSFDAAAAVEKIKQLRAAADDGYRAGGPGATDLARASKNAASALEDALEAHLQSTGQQPLLADFRDARQLIAKTYSVEKALNPTTGSVDAKKLAAQLAKGKPLSGDLKTAADFAARFPKAAQTPEAMGSLPQASPLDWAAGAGLSAATSNPLAMASVAARPAVRALTLSDLVQNRLIQKPSRIGNLLANDRAQQLIYRAAPAIAADR